MQKQKKVALVELGGSHAECLHFQIRCLHQYGYIPYIICNTNLWPQIIEKNLVEGYHLETMAKKFWSQLQNFRRIQKFLQKNGIRTVVINTTEIKVIRNFIFSVWLRINYTGIVHNGNKLRSGTTLRKLLSKIIRKFFVLNDFIVSNIKINSSITIASFYPIYFPPYKHCSVAKPAGETWIAIPGVVSSSRKDYHSLFAQLVNQPPDSNIKIILLGCFNTKEESGLYKEIQQHQSLQQNIVYFEHYLDYDLFHYYLNQCDVILPLIHDTNMYDGTRISGAMNLSFAYKIPMLSEAVLMYAEDIRNSSLFYEKNNLVSFIKMLPQKKEEILQVKETMQQEPKWKLDFQYEKYIALIDA